ncbi:hypothetical protein [Helicobacter zhangjianzhongii]|uniref:Uncharacterized protein n=1 Tax=Helicobacter zhangjianzhongii TaxID=2974574 RepID=A0ACC6FQY9_9HELI|nr:MULTISPECIES: hypothetical protein [unclassified Helicobacter]MDL0079473.1 hypothetical protein [Helicobacter sp. CPD2-1]MDL0081626.1 hypothetical protein [Helicobacter sp. XJK30-2]
MFLCLLFSKVDSRGSRLFCFPTCFPTPPWDSRIVEIESGFFKSRKEIRLERLSRELGDEIHDSSPQAKSLSKSGF